MSTVIAPVLPSESQIVVAIETPLNIQTILPPNESPIVDGPEDQINDNGKRVWVCSVGDCAKEFKCKKSGEKTVAITLRSMKESMKEGRQ
jgi:hypothetical protein